jgi:hypothetical protein
MMRRRRPVVSMQERFDLAGARTILSHRVVLYTDLTREELGESA